MGSTDIATESVRPRGAWAWAWAEGFRRLRGYVDREGHARVPARYAEDDGYRLGNWVWVQRGLRRRGGLSDKQIVALERVPGWEWEPREARFEAGISRLRVFAAREGHTRVPRAHREGTFPLGGWVASIRAALAAGGLGGTHKKRLQEVPHWTSEGRTRGFMEAEFQRRLVVLRRRITRDGRVARSAEDGLGSWVHRLRQSYRAGDLSSARIAALEAVPGWRWASRQAGWQRRYEALRRYIAREGHARVPVPHVEAGVCLRPWIQLQRRRYFAGTLEADRMRALEKIRTWSWRPADARWERALAALRRFAAREGHARVPVLHVEAGVNLGAWAQVVRRRRRKRTLMPAQIKDLEGIPGWRWVRRRPRLRA